MISKFAETVEKFTDTAKEVPNTFKDSSIEKREPFADSSRPIEKYIELPKLKNDTDSKEKGIFSDSERPSDKNGIEQPQLKDSVIEASTGDKIQRQNEEISNVENGIKTLDNTLEKGNYGEMKADQKLRELGWERVSTEMVTDIDDNGHQGIDGVYKNSDGKFLILEVKYGYAQLSPTLDGMQMSDNWIDKRLDDAVGKTMTDEIRFAMLSDPNNVYNILARVDETGNVTFYKLDNNASIIGKDVNLND